MYDGDARSCGTKPRCSATTSTSSVRAKSAISHISSNRAASLRRHEADGAHHRRNIGIALALEAAEHGRQPNAERRQPIHEPPGDFRRPSSFVRGMKLDRRHTQFMRHVEIHAQAGVETGKHTEGPFVGHRKVASG